MSALLALSDGLVVRALERAAIRGLPGDLRRRSATLNIPKHRAYERFRIPAARHGHVLEDAFPMTAEIADRWQLPVDADAWSRVLYDYCRGLLVSMQPHTLDDLAAALELLGAGHAV
ncbi:hypothetical protein [uncultured Jatrophihabitans sp.]|uniref:hypothetical protein n=1 Tax=uncultured Jatrophihabitans sp. TaxID=1610747 RepID=UPI0035C9B01E